MRVKIDTKETFHVISIEEHELTAIMAEELKKHVKEDWSSSGKSLIIDMQHVHAMAPEIASCLNELHIFIYASGKSFVICSLKPAARTTLEEMGVFEVLNITPTESEAWDIVQMEEIERELGMDS